MPAAIPLKKITDPKTGLTSTYNDCIQCYHSISSFEVEPGTPPCDI
jgi:hypothetical protein